MKKILFIVGSQRKNSFNHQLAQQLIQFSSNQIESTILNYQDVPFFNEDIEDPIPESVFKVKQQIQKADYLFRLAYLSPYIQLHRQQNPDFLLQIKLHLSFFRPHQYLKQGNHF